MSEGFRYGICGLEVASDFRLPEAQPGQGGPPSVRIREGFVPSLGLPGNAFQRYAVTADGDLIEYRDTTRFLVRNGSEIIGYRDADFDVRLIGLPILGAVFALLMHRRGRFVLHGSAVEIGGTAHIFLGDKGAGKSTTAAGLIAAGHRLIADDVVVLEHGPGKGGPVIYPGYPAMKLGREMLPCFARDTYEILQPDDGAYTGGKARIRLTRPFATQAFPLGRLYCLARGAHHGFEAFGKADTLRTLIRFSYYPRFGGDALSPRESAPLFARAASLAGQVDCGRLTVKDGLDHIASLAGFLNAGEVDEPAVG